MRNVESRHDSGHLLDGQVALITGASRGIGAATAVLLGQQGAAVGVNYVKNKEAAQAVVDQIIAAGGKAIPVQADAGDATQVEAIVKEVTETFGPIDTLVLNAASVRRFLLQPFLQ